MEVFKKWEDAKLFCPRFYTKLRDIAVHILLLRIPYMFTMLNKKRPFSPNTIKHFSVSIEMSGRSNSPKFSMILIKSKLRANSSSKHSNLSTLICVKQTRIQINRNKKQPS